MLKTLAALTLVSFTGPALAFIERPDETPFERGPKTSRAVTANCDKQTKLAAEALLSLNLPTHLYSIDIKEVINLGTEKTDEGEWINNSTAHVKVVRKARTGRGNGSGIPRSGPNFYEVRVKMVYEPELRTCDVITISIEP